MSSHTLAAIALIAAEPDTSGKTVRAALGVSKEMSSKILRRLGPSGLGWIGEAEDPRDRRNKLYRLTARGKSEATLVLGALTGEMVKNYEPPLAQPPREEPRTRT
jgi:DNA-binding MarR family transcriptional regulator